MMRADFVTFKVSAGVVQLGDGDDKRHIVGGVASAFGNAGDGVIVADSAETLSGGSSDDALTAGSAVNPLDSGICDDKLIVASGTMATLGEGDDVLTSSAYIATD